MKRIKLHKHTHPFYLAFCHGLSPYLSLLFVFLFCFLHILFPSFSIKFVFSSVFWYRFISSFLPPFISHTLTRFVSHPVSHTHYTQLVSLSLWPSLSHSLFLLHTLSFLTSSPFFTCTLVFRTHAFFFSVLYLSVLFLSLSVLSQSLLSLIFFTFSLSPSFLSSSVVAFISHFLDSLSHTQSFALNLTLSSSLFSRTDRNDPHIDFHHVCFKPTSLASSLHLPMSFSHTQ